MSKNQETLSANIKSTRQITGGCHCQAVRFRAMVATDAVVLRCNCSICTMTGFNHLIVPHPDFELLCGETELSQYQFNSLTAKHLFCRICGIKSFYQPRSHPDCWSINTHCVDNFKPNQWAHQDFDGHNWQTAITSLPKQTEII